MSVDRGPLTYSLAIDERYERLGDTEELAVYPESPWNYGLVSGASFELVEREPGDNPFTASGVPIALTTQAQRIPEWETDSLEAPDSGRVPESSADTSIPRFTWWDRRGTTEWIEYDLRSVRELSEVSTYWYDDTGTGQCRVPQSWRVLWLDGEMWRPVDNTTPYEVAADQLNTTTFTPVRAQHLRVEAVLRPGYSGGLFLLAMT
ncbi:hypothetical protein GCM10010522_39440 [Kribbella solani]|nr:discoidin domain-containing protein [Kribbella solani]